MILQIIMLIVDLLILLLTAQSRREYSGDDIQACWTSPVALLQFFPNSGAFPRPLSLSLRPSYLFPSPLPSLLPLYEASPSKKGKKWDTLSDRIATRFGRLGSYSLLIVRPRRACRLPPHVSND